MNNIYMEDIKSLHHLGFKYLFLDFDGKAFATRVEPIIRESQNCPGWLCYDRCRIRKLDKYSDNWQTSLISLQPEIEDHYLSSKTLANFPAEERKKYLLGEWISNKDDSKDS